MGGEQGPYPYQERLAFERVESRLIQVPTGAGKSAAAILAWFWWLNPRVKQIAQRETPAALSRENLDSQTLIWPENLAIITLHGREYCRS